MKVPAARIEFRKEDRDWVVQRIDEILASGQLTLGKFGEEFEQRFAELCGVKYAVATNSGTSALEISLRALGAEGKDVLVPTNTFFATAAAVVHAGARPVLVDVEPESLGMSAKDAERRLTPATAGMVVVHVGGLIARELPALRELCRSRGLWLLEDAAHAHGSTLGGVCAGAFGRAAAFSFYPTKVMTSAEGGMIATDDPELVAEARILRDQGKASFTQNAHVRLGYNWRLSEPHAVIGLRHLERLSQMIADRQRVAALYSSELRGHPKLRVLEPAPDSTSNFYKYLVVVSELSDRPGLKRWLREKFDVSLAGEVYEAPLHRQPVFAHLARGTYPVADDLCARHVCLPIYSGMSDAEARHAVRSLRAALD